MEPWLNRNSLTQFIGTQEIPASFKVDKLSTTTREVVEGWLTDLITAENVILYNQVLGDNAVLFMQMDAPTADELMAIPLTLAQYTIGRLIMQFVAYAVWTVYINKANAINTDTGIVSKLNPDSERISDRLRAELSSYYRGLAESKALQLVKLTTVTGDCRPSRGSGRPRIFKAQPKSPSRLGN